MMNAVTRTGRETVLGDVREQVRMMAVDYSDRYVPVKDVSFESLSNVRVGSEMFYLREQAQRLIASRLKIPYDYLARCETEIQAGNINHWFEKEKNTELFFRFDGGDVRAVFTPRYQPLDNVEVIDRLTDLYPENTKVICNLDGDIMYLGIVSEGTRVIRGDTMKRGISVINSEIGLHRLAFMIFIFRLICTNGLTIAQGIGGMAYKHISRKILDMFNDVIGNVDSSGDIAETYIARAMDIPVQNPINLLEDYNRKYNLSSREIGAVEWAWLNDPEYRRNPIEGDVLMFPSSTMYDIINTYTYAGHAPDINANESFRLEKTGGDILVAAAKNGKAWH